MSQNCNKKAAIISGKDICFQQNSGIALLDLSREFKHQAAQILTAWSNSFLTVAIGLVITK